jgi:NAD(P)-dependent dehydrogenase (short-subunit alcohol dehydrogenase family)
MTDRNTATALVAVAAGAGALLALRATLWRRRAYDFRDKVVLITGGSRGLGLELSRELAAKGAKLAICARDPGELRRAKDELEASGARVFTHQCDVTDKADVDTLVATVAAHLGPVDVLVNNAGVIEVGPLESMTLGDFEETMKTHFWGPLYATMAVLPRMRARRSGRIVNISSIGGKIGVPHLVPYCASKFALAGLSEGLRAELVKENVYVTAVYPGLMRTGSPRNATFKGQHRAEYAWFSISDALPVTAMSSKRAARQIVSAAGRGEAEVILSVQARAAIAFKHLCPELAADLAAVANALLPAPGGIGTGRALGKDSESKLSPSPLTVLGERAALRNNEVH